MKIKEKALSEIYLNPDNPRNNEGAVDAVAESINAFGFKVPIVVNTDGMILAGNTRYKAAQRLGLEKVPCVIADDLDEVKQKAFILADNKTAELAEWDFELLEKELSELSDLNFDMSEFGFEDDMGDIPEEVKLPREEQGTAGQLPSIKFGTTTINLTEEEADRFNSFYKAYLEKNGTAFGLLLELLEHGDKNYES